MATDTILARARRPVDRASLEVFRIIFGLLMAVGVVRFWAYGWIEALYLEPAFHFKYWGFGWLEVWPAPGLYLHFALLGLAALAVGLGLWTRAALAVFLVLFGYVELLDKTTYLNHYYLISLLALLMLFLPVGRGFALDVWRRPERARDTVPAWVLWTMRAQVGLVYVFAGLAKVGGDWLLRGQPLATWLGGRELPLLGGLLAQPGVALAMAWAGMLFDLSLPFLLLWRRTRVVAFAAGLIFHVLTWMLFPLGLFPWIMIACTTLFFAPDWPRRVLGTRRSPRAPQPVPPQRARWRLGAAALGLYFLLQLGLPLRAHLYPGDPLWTEQGFRFAWKVMLIEKTGLVRYRVRARDGRTWHVTPEDAGLTMMQVQEMATQPDMILELAHHLAARFARDGLGPVEVRADAWVSLNGRRSQRLIDPEVDLAAQSDGLGAKPWILPLHGGGSAVPESKVTTPLQ